MYHKSHIGRRIESQNIDLARVFRSASGRKLAKFGAPTEKVRAVDLNFPHSAPINILLGCRRGQVKNKTNDPAASSTRGIDGCLGFNL